MLLTCGNSEATGVTIFLSMPEENTSLRWSAYEHDHIEREPDWYWALAIVAICAALTSIILSDFLFAVLILLAACTIALVSKSPPELTQFEISDRGVRINSTLHRFDEILSFWVLDEHDGRPLLLIDTTKFLAPNLVIPIEHIDSQLVRAYLAERTSEVPMREPLSHKVLEFFGI
jgi:hypothetical protein